MKKLLIAAGLLAAASASAYADDVTGKLVLYTSQPNADAQATVDAFTRCAEAGRTADRRHGDHGEPEAGRSSDGA